ncbi:MAG: helix-turn-helix domain-containing protein [Eubacterium sp.]|nr:helix-turn-helix domain-containing protein [Eubacterium sp.]
MDKTEYQKIFSHNLIKYMSMYDKSQSDLINDLGFNKSAVSTWVNGTRMPRMDKVNMLAEYFGIRRSDLIEDKTGLEEKLPITQYSDEEKEVIALYRSLKSEQSKKTVLANLKFLKVQESSSDAPD